MKRLIKKLTVITAITVLLMACNFEYETPGVAFVPVESITGVPTGGIARYELVLARSVLPDNATNKTITWSVIEDGGTDTVLNRNILTAQNPGTIKVNAVIKNGMAANADYSEDFEIRIYHEDDYVRVMSISGVPEECGMGEIVDLSSAFVKPLNAVNTTIIWEVKDARETGAQISGNMLTTTAMGTFVITARVADGKSPGVDFIRDFTIVVITPTVKSITGVPAKCYVGDTTLSAVINPPDVFAIIWTVKDAGTTGAQINGNTLTVTAMGTLVITARIVDGVSPGVDYTQDFAINVLPPPDVRVYVIGYDNDSQACYWRDGVQTLLPLPSGYNKSNSGSYTTSIIEADGSVYITGCYYKTTNYVTHPCYWKDGRLEFYNNEIEAYTNGIAVSGSDVYMSGNYNGGIDIPCYWKNNIRTALTVPVDAVKGCYTVSIAVAGSTVYVVGYYNDEYDLNTTNFYWKITGGVQERIIFSEPISCDYIAPNGGIAVLNGDVYAAGFYNDGINDIACYWKNGTYAGNLPVPFGTVQSYAGAIVWADGTLYISGVCGNSDWSSSTGCYWKWNGTSFGSSVSITGCTSENGVSAYDGKVYVAGHDGSYFCYWADGTRKNLSGSIGAVSGIVAVWE